MQPIIVAIDFSNTSLHALEYAITMANKMRSDIQMIWVDKVISQDSVYPDASKESRNEAKKRFVELAASHKGHLVKGISLDYKLKKGRIYREVETLARTIEAELIIAGAHGISGYEQFWIGSNAYKIVSYSQSPVITVRQSYPIKKKIDRILFPIGGSPDTLQKLPFVLKLATLFKSEIHVVSTHSSHLKSIQRITNKLAQTALAHLQKHGIVAIEDSILSNDLTRAVLDYAGKVDADLIAIMTEQETPVNILLGAQAQLLINQSPIPVLSIHPQENFILD